MRRKVKRGIHVFVAVAVYAIWMVCVVGVWMRCGSLTDVQDVARGADGAVYAAGSGTGNILVYQMDKDGAAVALHRCRQETRDANVFCQYEDGKLYICQIWYEEGFLYFNVRVKGEEDSGFASVWERKLEKDVDITDFHVSDGVLYLTGVEQQTGKILLYRDMGTRASELFFVCDFEPVTVCWGNGGLYTLSQDNHVYFIDLNGRKKKADLEDIVLLLADENGLYYQKQDSSDLTYSFYNGLNAYTYKDLGDVWGICHSDVAHNSAVLLNDGDRDRLLLVNEDGSDGRYLNSLYWNLDAGTLARELFLVFFAATAAYAAVLILIRLFFVFIWKKHRILYQTMAAVIGFSAVWLVATLAALMYDDKKAKEEEKMFYAAICRDIQKARLEENDGISYMKYETYQDSAWQDAVNEIFLYGNKLNTTWSSYFVRGEILCGKETPVFVFSRQAAYGRRADTFYNSEAVAQVRKCLSSGEDQTFIDDVDGIAYAFAVTQFGNGGNAYCLVSRIPVEGSGRGQETLPKLYIYAVVGWAVVMVILVLFLRRKWYAVGALVAQMDRVSKGDYRIEPKKVPGNEFGTMWRAMERLCKNLNIRSYKDTGVMEYIYQFAPKNFESLFGRENLQEIEAGETVVVQATLGIISVIDRDALSEEKVQIWYAQYVNRMIELLFSQEDSAQAVFLQSGSSLENVNVIFREKDPGAGAAVRYSIECMESLLGQADSGYETKPFILLHTSRFICGIAGGGRQAYPYVASMELETLNRCIAPLKESGVRIVVTQETWKYVQDWADGRYIGYVKSKDGQYTFYLYELLDACPHMIRLGRHKNKGRFVAALELYNENLFYEARGAFTEILKECPDDGIARWYVFACDRMIGREDMARHDLFWDQV